MSNTRQIMQDVIDELLPVTIIKEYRTPDRRRENEAMTLGVAISVWSEWSGNRIMEVFAEALEDANFSTEANEVRTWIELLDNQESWDEYWKKLQP